MFECFSISVSASGWELLKKYEKHGTIFFFIFFFCFRENNPGLKELENHYFFQYAAVMQKSNSKASLGNTGIHI